MATIGQALVVLRLTESGSGDIDGWFMAPNLQLRR